MIKTIFDSDDFSAGDRLARFDGLQATSAHPMRVHAARPNSFRATARCLDLGTVELVELTSSPARIVRNRKLIMESDPELSAVLLPIRGRVDLAQQGRRTSLGPGELALYDSSHPFDVRLDEPTTLLRAQLPSAMLPPAARIEPVLGVRISGRAGISGLLVETLTRLMTDAASYRLSDLTRLGPVITDLMAATLASQLDHEPDLPGASGRRGLLLGIEAFVQRHLSDPDLSPNMIAAAHHISVSYLHRLCQGQGWTLAASIRERRLERIRRDLADPALLDVPVHRIAARWAFVIMPASAAPFGPRTTSRPEPTGEAVSCR
ncbi:MAG TPA: hypothetical protein VIP98_06725 [Microlunatus sp.]